MKDKLEGIIKKHIFKDRRLKKSVQKTLRRHAENYSQLKIEKSRIKEDKHAYEFIHAIYFGDMHIIEKYMRFYERLKRNFMK